MVRKAMALIRANFHIDPETLDYDTFCKLHAEAFWLEHHRTEALGYTIASTLRKMF